MQPTSANPVPMFCSHTKCTDSRLLFIYPQFHVTFSEANHEMVLNDKKFQSLYNNSEHYYFCTNMATKTKLTEFRSEK